MESEARGSALWRALVQSTVSLGLLAVLLRLVDLHALAAALAAAAPTWIAAAIVIKSTARVLMVVKWRWLLRAGGIAAPLGSALRWYYRAVFLAQILPASLGGDALRIYYASRAGLPAAAVLPSILVERLIGFVVILALSGGGLALLTLYFEVGSDLSPLAGAIALLGLAAGAAIALSLSQPVARLIARTEDSPRSLLRGLGRAYGAYRRYRDHPGTLIAFLLATCTEAALHVLAACTVVAALGADVPTLFVVAFAPVAILLSRLPVTISGWGVHEGSFVYFLSLAGVPASVGLAAGLASHLVLVASSLPGAALLVDPRQRRAEGAPGSR